MTDRLLAASLRYAETVERCATPKEVILGLDAAAWPTMRVLGIWPVPLATQRGNREPYAVHIHPKMQPFLDDFWPKLKANGPSVLARRAWRTQRDFSLRDVLQGEHPKPSDLWIFQLLQQHGIGDVRYMTVFRWWHAVFWSPLKSVQLSKSESRALRIAAQAAVERIEELEGPRGDCQDPGLTDRERDVLRLLLADRTATQVAGQLKVDPATVKKYIARSKAKLGTKALRDTLAEAVRRYVVLAAAGAVELAVICELCDFDWTLWS